MRTCKLDGCENSLEGMQHNAKYCCGKHKNKARNQSPEYKAKRRAYQQTPEHKAYQKAYRQNPERKAKDKDYREAYYQSPEYKAKNRARNQSPEYKANKRMREQKRRAQKAALPATLATEDWQQTLTNFSRCCAYCDQPFGNEPSHQEHFIPLSKGGPYTLGNILPVCSSCNFSKRDKDPEDFLSPERYKKLKRYLGDQKVAMQYSFTDLVEHE